MHSRKFWMTLLMCAVLICCALLLDGLAPWMRAAVLAMAATVACVWVVSEARVDRAAAPLRIERETEGRDSHPPDQAT